MRISRLSNSRVLKIERSRPGWETMFYSSPDCSPCGLRKASEKKDYLTTTARFFIHDILLIWGFTYMGFPLVFPLWYCKTVFLCPGSIVDLYFSVQVVLYTVFSAPTTLAKTTKSQQNIANKYGGDI